MNHLLTMTGAEAIHYCLGYDLFPQPLPHNSALAVRAGWQDAETLFCTRNLAQIEYVNQYKEKKTCHVEGSVSHQRVLVPSTSLPR